MPEPERGNNRESTSGRKPDTNTNRNMEHEDEESNLPYDVQVMKSYARDLGEIHKSYSGATKRMGHPGAKKFMQKCMNGHVDDIVATKDKSEKCYPEHKIHDIDTPAKHEFKKSEDEGDEDDDDEEEDEGGDEEMSNEEKSMLESSIKDLQAQFNTIAETMKAHQGL